MLTEQRVVKQVSILPQSDTVNVQWAVQILRDGEVISEQYERKAYQSDHVAEFVAEVEDAESYLSAIGWQ